MAVNMRKYVRKSAKSGLCARSSALTMQIEADLTQGSLQARYGQFAHWIRCKSLKVQALPANLRLSSEQIGSYHFDPVYEFTA